APIRIELKAPAIEFLFEGVVLNPIQSLQKEFNPGALNQSQWVPFRWKHYILYMIGYFHVFEDDI
ncbi:MAG: hypothetical protein ACM3JI_00875, partial [Anaerolineae bacterium]